MSFQPTVQQRWQLRSNRGVHRRLHLAGLRRRRSPPRQLRLADPGGDPLADLFLAGLQIAAQLGDHIVDQRQDLGFDGLVKDLLGLLQGHFLDPFGRHRSRRGRGSIDDWRRGRLGRRGRFTGGVESRMHLLEERAERLGHRGLDQHADSARRLSFFQIARFFLRGIHGHRHRGIGRIAADLPHRSQSIHARHGVIHENRVRPLGAQIIERFLG